MKKNFLVILLSIILLTILTGCVYEEMEPTTHDAQMDKLESTTESEATDNNLQIPSLTQSVAIPGEEFTLECVYDTGSYNLNDWRITDSKEISMSVHTINLPEGYEVFIDHVHADISLHGKNGRFNGIKQDEMDDSFHGYNQPGFFINNETIYKNIFSIEGYNNEFVECSGTYAYVYGYVSSDLRRITEINLRDWGVDAEKLMVVYDLNIKAPEDTYYHTVSVSTEMLIPVSEEKTYLTTTKQKDGVTYTIYYDKDDTGLENPLFAYDTEGNKYSEPGVLWEE